MKTEKNSNHNAVGFWLGTGYNPGADHQENKAIILVVDDDARMLQSVKELLNVHGYSCLTADGGRAALNLMAQKKVDLMLLDLYMPDVDGHQVMKEMKTRFPATDMIVVSGKTSFDNATQALRNGAQDFLRKPYLPDELIKAIKNILHKRRLEREMEEVRERLKSSEQAYRFVVDSSPDMIYILDRGGHFIFLNEQIQMMLSFHQDELIGKHYSELVCSEDLDKAQFTFNERRTGDRSSSNVELRLVHKHDGRTAGRFEISYVSVDLCSKGVYMENAVAKGQEFVGTYGVLRDITERKQAEIQKEQLLHDMGERVKELQCMYGITEILRSRDTLDEIFRKVINIIPAGWHYPNYTKARIVFDGKRFVDGSIEQTKWKQSSDLTVDEKYRGSVEVYYTKEFPELDEGPFLKEERNLINGIARTLSDAIELKQVEAELKHLATHDPLTELYNRKVLEQRLIDEIHRATRYNKTLSVFMLDVDHFKPVNDTYGHGIGDTVLCGIAQVLESSIRKTDYAARYGGEEFVVILPETPLSKAEELAERLCNDIAEHSILLAGGKELNITVSVGIASYPEHAQSWEDLLKAADSAMYAAKRAGRNCVRTAENTI